MIRQLKTMNDQQLKEILAIWLKSNIETHDYISPVYWDQNFTEVEKALPAADIYVYEDNHKILAFIGVVEGYIAGLFVAHVCRGQGIGSQLLERVKKEHASLRLSVFSKNERAIAFYQSHGFVLQQEQVDPETNENEWSMIWQKDV